MPFRRCKTEQGIKLRGKDPPRPFFAWHQCGLTNKILLALSALGYEKPFAIQQQAIPTLMSAATPQAVPRVPPRPKRCWRARSHSVRPACLGASEAIMPAGNVEADAPLGAPR